MADIAIVACSNGLGHVRRTLLLARTLAGHGAEVILYAPQSSVAKIERALGASPCDLTVIDFDTCSSPHGFREGDERTVRWIERLPSLDEFNMVVSDNLPEILERRPDAILSGSFLWHEALGDIHPPYVENARRLLAEHRPVMLASAPLSPPYLQRVARVHEIGLWQAFERPTGPGRDLLIACGHGGADVEILFSPIVKRLLEQGPGGYRLVHVEPRLLPDEVPGWMRPAAFDSGLYSDLRAVICRPGVGTVSDALIAGARIFSLYEPGNGEMKFNARRLTALGLGAEAAGPSRAVEEALRYSIDTAAQTQQWRRTAAIDSDGGETAARYLLAQVGKAAR